LPTISDVARQAGVSPATVSRVIQGARNVSPATRERVEQAIGALGYVPSAVAQSLRSKRTRSLALVVSDIANTFWTTVARGVEDEAQRQGYSVLLCNTDENLAKQLRYLDLLIGQQVDGVVIAPYDSDAQHLDKLRQRNIPTVLVDRRIVGWDLDSVCGDSVAGARALIQHLIKLGHRRIAVISGPETASTAEDRIAGYCLALAEAGIPQDPHLLRRGEYRSAAGEELTRQLLDEGLNPSAIFAANNAIAMGVIDALEKRGLCIPQDVALVSYDDLPDASHLFPFLTVVAQPAYDMGVNAAQLLLSRLGSEVELRPRHVVLPVRLIVRHSCGSQVTSEGRYPLSLPIPKDGLTSGIMVKPSASQERPNRLRGTTTTGMPLPLPDLKPDVNRLLRVLKHREADQVPHLELSVASKAICEYVLERELDSGLSNMQLGALPITPEDHVDLALRLGLDAVPCHFSWQPNGAGLDNLPPPLSLADQLSLLERYLRAARGTGVGVIAYFTSFFDSALRAVNVESARGEFAAQRPQIEQWMDVLLANQERVMRVVCDRFAGDLALVMIDDNLADQGGLRVDGDAFELVIAPRIRRLIAPALEHGKPLLLHSQGQLRQLLPLLYDIGFAGVHLVNPELNDLLAIKKQWAGRLALSGGIPTTLLAQGTREQIEAAVRDTCRTLAPGGGYVFGSSQGMSKEVPLESLIALVWAFRRYSRYGSLGEEGPYHQNPGDADP